MDEAVNARRLRVARVMLWSVFAAILFVRVVSGRDQGSGWTGIALAGLSYPLLAAIIAGRRSLRTRIWLVAGLAVTAVLPFAVVSDDWDWVPWALAAGVLCAFPPRVGWPLFAVILLAVGAYAVHLGDNAPMYVPDVVAATVDREVVTADDALIVFSLVTLVEMVRCLGIAQQEAARLAQLRERTRVDGELRDVIGRRLQAILFRLRRASAEDREEASRDVAAASESARSTLAEVRALADSYRSNPGAGGSPPIESPRVARIAMVAVALIQCGLVMNNLYPSPPGGLFPLGSDRLAVAWTLIAALAVLFAVKPTRIVLAAQTALILVPLLFLNADGWSRVLPLLIGTVLVRVRPPWSWAAVAVLIGGHYWMLAAAADSVLHGVTGLVGDVILAVWVYSLSRLADLVAVLRRSRQEIAASAVLIERTRIARDLHDVLGFRLSAVALKGELAVRLLDRDPARAADEVGALIEVVGDGILELQDVTGDRTRLRLAAEAVAARDLLEVAGIRVDLTLQAGPLADDSDTVGALILREAVTNVLRHSVARRCEISVVDEEGSVWIRVLNDGVVEHTDSARSGNGLENLARRVEGRLTAAANYADGTFELRAQLSSGHMAMID
ncbi:sensor histidine kinase [Catenulispora acidiphila]|uniref:sensor histidine kinase n=1 Tax=Catenulispora acidiphila TaxID=304895 RepID=UPI00019DEFB4|nr:histidine kinase [Catenulispora acidiphila]